MALASMATLCAVALSPLPLTRAPSEARLQLRRPIVVPMMKADEPQSGKTGGRRIGGSVRRKASRLPAMDDDDDWEIPLAASVVPIAFFVLAASSLFGLAGQGGRSFSYSVSSYSETRVLRDDGSGQPKYETKRESSFKTNVPGLAERLAQQGREPADAAGRLFP